MTNIEHRAGTQQHAEGLFFRHVKASRPAAQTIARESVEGSGTAGEMARPNGSFSPEASEAFTVPPDVVYAPTGVSKLRFSRCI
jgi:hypothetical protein